MKPLLIIASMFTALACHMPSSDSTVAKTAAAPADVGGASLVDYLGANSGSWACYRYAYGPQDATPPEQWAQYQVPGFGISQDRKQLCAPGGTYGKCFADQGETQYAVQPNKSGLVTVTLDDGDHVAYDLVGQGSGPNDSLTIRLYFIQGGNQGTGIWIPPYSLTPGSINWAHALAADIVKSDGFGASTTTPWTELSLAAKIADGQGFCLPENDVLPGFPAAN
jgi:hypothetical protein